MLNKMPMGLQKRHPRVTGESKILDEEVMQNRVIFEVSFTPRRRVLFDVACHWL